MSFRNRPVLDRKHRPRWQDELRTQQLIVAGFALAIAVAVGIFAAAAWSGFYQSNLRQAALVDGTPIERAAIVKRIQMVASELQATAVDLQGHAGGMRDQIIQQQLQTVDTTLGNVQGSAPTPADRPHARPARGRAGRGADRRGGPGRDRPAAAERHPAAAVADHGHSRAGRGRPAGDEPTDQQWADAKAEIDAIKDELDGGGDFETLAEQRSDDPSKALKGLLGWVERTDGQYGDYFKAAAKAEAGDVIGPIKNDTGWYLLKVDDRQAGGRDTMLDDLLSEVGVTDEEYRDYIRQEVLRGDFQQYFKDSVLVALPAAARGGADLPEPRPGAAGAEAARPPPAGAADPGRAGPVGRHRRPVARRRQEAEKLRQGGGGAEGRPLVGAGRAERRHRAAPRRGGYLGWYDPAAMAQQFVPKFATAANDLRSARSARWSAPSSATTSSRSPSVAPARWSWPIGWPPSCGRILIRSPTWRRPRARMSAAPGRAGSWAGSSTTRTTPPR